MNRICMVLFVLILSCSTGLAFDNGQPVDIKKYLEYAELVELKIKEKDPLVLDYLDTLGILQSNINTDLSNGIFNRINGLYFNVKGNMEKSLTFYNKATSTLLNCCYENQETVKSLLGENGSLLNSGLYNFDTVYFKKGALKVKKALEIATVLKDTNYIVRCLDFFGDHNYYSAFQVENMDSALYYYKAALKINENRKTSPKVLASNYLGLANVYRNLDNQALERKYFNNSKLISEENNLYGTLYALYNDKAEKYEKSGDHQEALRLKLIAYDYVKKDGSIEFMNRADRQMYSSYKQIGNFENALFYYEKYNNTLEEMHKDKALKFQSAIETKRNLSIKEEEILKLEIRNSKTIKNYLLLLTSLVIITLFVSLWANIILRRKNKALSEKNKEIILARLKGQNSERKRMAGELHDNLNTKIAAVRWQLEAVQDKVRPDQKLLISKLIFQLNDVYEDVRLISHNLMPETVETIGLIQAISDLVSKLNESDNVNFNLVTDLPMDENFNALSYPLYNIIFEMINNVLKHSDATNAWISISKNKLGDLSLSVSDDGKGFDVDQMKNGYGIKSITSRIQNLNGQWSIESAPEKGTKIYMEIPNL